MLCFVSALVDTVEELESFSSNSSRLHGISHLWPSTSQTGAPQASSWKVGYSSNRRLSEWFCEALYLILDISLFLWLQLHLSSQLHQNGPVGNWLCDGWLQHSTNHFWAHTSVPGSNTGLQTGMVCVYYRIFRSRHSKIQIRRIYFWCVFAATCILMDVMWTLISLHCVHHLRRVALKLQR